MFGSPEVSYQQTYSARDWLSILRTSYPTQNLQRKYKTGFFRLFIPCIFCTYCNKVTNECNCLFSVFISFIFTLHILGSHKPIIRGISSCFLYTTIWFMWCLCCSSACACDLVCRGGFTVNHDRPVYRHTQMSNIDTT